MTETEKDLTPAQFVAEAERLTNNYSIAEPLALFAPDCVAEWVFDGVYQRHEGIEAIAHAMRTMVAVNRRLGLHGDKSLVCADDTTIVNTWQGGFRGDRRQFGTEIWTLRDGLVVHHRMNIYLRLRSADSPAGRLRMLLGAPRTALAWFRYDLRPRSRAV